ncbi:MAG: serine/threonine-protein kinase [Thermoguttaceae bacterium]
MIDARPESTFVVSAARRPLPRVVRQRINQWELLELVSEGTLTRTYRARPAGAGRPAAYALKLLRPERQEDPGAIALLRREALVGRTVCHPHLVSILATRVGAPPYYVVMPWLSGATLAARLAGGRRLPLALVFWVARQVAEALAALHEAGWMHGDVKPGNILVSPEGHVTLLDLGFARRLDRADPSFQRRISGTYHYIAPEALSRALNVDIRSDIYSLGVVLFEMLCGRLPFEGEDAADLARQHRGFRVPELERFAPSIPSEAAALVRQMLAKEPLRRPQTPRELVDRLVALEIATFARRWGG